MATLLWRTNDTYAFLISQDGSSNNNASVPNIATAALKIPHGLTMTSIIIVLVEVILISAFIFALAKWCLNKPALTRQPQHEAEKTASPLQKVGAPKLEIVFPEPIHIDEDKRPDSDSDASSTLHGTERSPNNENASHAVKNIPQGTSTEPS